MADNTMEQYDQIVALEEEVRLKEVEKMALMARAEELEGELEELNKEVDDAKREEQELLKCEKAKQAHKDDCQAQIDAINKE